MAGNVREAYGPRLDGGARRAEGREEDEGNLRQRDARTIKQLTKQSASILGNSPQDVCQMYVAPPSEKVYNIRIYHCFTTKSLKSTPEPTGCLCGKAWSICLPGHMRMRISIGQKGQCDKCTH